MLKPIRDNIVLKVIEQEAKTAGGIVLPGSALEKPYRGEVVAANESFTMPDGSVKECEVKVGDTVYFGKTHGTEVKQGDENYLVISEEFILCKE
ncbi:co-chaperone GroES [Marinobacterium lutimaris]|uniref:Co-chaperonin GroES n=1 Tax=Marinobacterium lutimaris TaxID=568106 RepID=A0A1H5XKH9_9GAMM|nr:co-chaperone GroES [Marinobacterium lutimaris]SEG12274.1 chaperonin GroES [Marinobacterium lutimaris]